MPRHGRGWAIGGNAREVESHSPLVGSLLEPALLILLSQHPSHGYTLLSEISTLNMATIHPSVVYRTLREMENLGWISSDWESEQTQGPPRRNYHLTTQGDTALQSWKQELEKTDEILLKLLEMIQEK